MGPIKSSARTTSERTPSRAASRKHLLHADAEGAFFGQRMLWRRLIGETRRHRDRNYRFAGQVSRAPDAFAAAMLFANIGMPQSSQLA